MRWRASANQVWAGDRGGVQAVAALIGDAHGVANLEHLHCC